MAVDEVGGQEAGPTGGEMKMKRVSCLALVACLLIVACKKEEAGATEGQAAPKADAGKGSEARMEQGGRQEEAVRWWTDPASKLTWQIPAVVPSMAWKDASQYCRKLTLGGHQDWRLPTVLELRTLIRGCPATHSDGSCNIGEGGCLGSNCSAATCVGCGEAAGPVDGCYQPDELGGQCGWCWTSTSAEGKGGLAWGVNFKRAQMFRDDPVKGRCHVRCVFGVESGRIPDGQGLLAREQALEAARREVARHSTPADPLVVIEDSVEEYEFGWVFHATSRRYLETKDRDDAPVGLGPLVVDRTTGRAEFLGSGVHPLHAIRAYESKWRERQGTRPD